MKAEKSHSRRISAEKLLVAAILSLAILIRVGHLIELRNDPFIDRPIMDAEYHDAWARSILSGQPFLDGVFFRAPLYPYFLAAIYAVFGAGPWPIRLVQMAMGVVSLLLVYRIARRIGGRNAALAALALASLYDLTPFYEGELLLKALMVLLVLAAFDRFVAFLDSRPAAKLQMDLLVAGGLLGLAAVTRPNVLAVVPGFAILAMGRLRRISPVALFVIAAFSFPAIVTTMNWVRGGDPVFIASQGGINLFIGNNRSSDGWSAVAPELRPDWWGGYQDMVRIPEAEAKRKLRPSEVSAYWTRRAFSEIEADPVWWVKHLARKTYLWFGAAELSNNRDLAFWKTRFPVIDALPVRYAHLVPLAVIGLLFVPWRRAAPIVLFVVPFALSFVLFFVTSRYRLVTVPLLAILAGIGLVGLGRLARRGAVAPLAWRLALLAALVALLSSGIAPVRQPTFALSYGEIGRREMERGRWADAATAFRAALAHDPASLDARHDLGVALREGGDLAGALAELSAVAAARGDATAWNNVGLTQWSLGHRTEARAAFQKAIERDPNTADAWLNSAVLAEEMGEWETALSALHRGKALRGEDPILWYHEGVIMAGLGRVEDARAAFERSLALAPNLADARVRLEALPPREPATGDSGIEISVPDTVGSP